jgi:hypothetical protein
VRAGRAYRHQPNGLLEEPFQLPFEGPTGIGGRGTPSCDRAGVERWVKPGVEAEVEVEVEAELEETAS